MSRAAGRRLRGAALLVALLAPGCDRAPDPTGGAATESAGGTSVRVALLHPGPESDRGWNELAYRALQSLATRRGVSVQHTYAPNKTAFKSEMRDYAQRGCTLVICHGSEFVKAAREVAGDFPKCRFVVTGSSDAGQGVTTIDFRLWEAAYLCGVLAAHLSPEGPAGLIGGQDFVTVRKTLDAFAEGARSVRKEYGAYTQYVGSWDDVAKAQQTARSLIETRGVRMLFQNTDAAASGIFQAADAAGVLAFGCNSDQASLAPAVVPASAVIDMERAFELALDAATGSSPAAVIVGDLKNGVIDVALNPAFATKWPAGALDALRRAKDEIVTARRAVGGG